MNDRVHIYIFLSYTTHEEEVQQVRPFVEAIVAELRENGYGKVIDPLVWWDRDRMGDYMGTDLKTVLATAIAECWHLLAFVSFSYWAVMVVSFRVGASISISCSRASPSPGPDFFERRAGSSLEGEPNLAVPP